MLQVSEFDAAMRRVAESLSDPGGREEALHRISKAAAETVPGADYASISIRYPDGHLATLSASAPIAVEFDELQYELREGPCYDAVTKGPVTYTGNLAEDPTWPRYGPRAAQRGMASQMAIRLLDDGLTMAGLNLYSRSLDGFADGADVAQLFASHATVALGYARQLLSLSGAIETREVIGKAIGIVMERYALSEERAVEFLIRVSQNTNTKLKVVAQRVVQGEMLQD